MCARRRLPLVIRAKVGKHRIARPRLMLCLWKQRCCTSTPTSSCTDLASAPAMERSRARRRDEWSSSHPAATRASTPVAAPPRERQARCACKSPGIGLPAGTGGSRNCGKAGPRTGRSRRQARRRCGRLRKWRGPGLSAPRAGDLLCRSGGTSTTMPEADGGLPIVVRVPGTYPGGSCGTDAHRAGLGKRRVARANGRPTAEHRGGCPDGRSACELNRCRGRAAPR